MSVTILGNKKLQVELLADESTKTQLTELNVKYNDLDSRVDTILTTPAESVSAEEIIDARDGYSILRKNIENIKEKQFQSKIIQRKFTKPTMTFIDDDTRSEVYTVWKPIAELYNIPITLATIGGKIGTPLYLTYEQIDELVAGGFELVGHDFGDGTISEGGYNNKTDNEMHQDFEKTQTWLKQNGGNPHVLVYPYGECELHVRNIVRQYFDVGIYTNGGINYPPLKTYRTLRQPLETTSLEQAKDLIDEMVLNNDGWLIWNSHCYDALWDIAQIQKTKDIIDYALAQGIEIENVENALKRFANQLEVGDYALPNQHVGVSIIDANGNTYGDEIGSSIMMVWTDVKAPNPNASLLTFKNKSKTTLMVTNIAPTGGGDFNSYGFPEFIPGILDTIRSDTFGYQKYTVYQSNREYTRYWNLTSNSWSAWEQTSITILTHDVAYASKLPNEMPRGFSVARFNNANATGTPEGFGGVLTTHNVNAGLFTYQEFIRAGTNNKWVRISLSQTDWGSWVRYALTTDMRQNIESIGSFEPNTISTFPVGLTIITCTTANATTYSLPTSIGGQLSTFRASYDLYSRQEYRTISSNDVYARRHDGTNFTLWEKIATTI